MSKIEIEIKKLEIDTRMPEGKKINKEVKVFFYFKLFGKFKILKKQVEFEQKNFDPNILKKKDVKINYKELVKNINIEKIDLNVQIGTEDAALTAILTGVVASLLGIIIQKPKYQVIPIFENKNFTKIKLECIFSIYLLKNIHKIIFKQSEKKIKIYLK